jgi:NAD(P)-dependent dehydrogenase (short-subunit alcohol dehydrogenase family)
MTSTTSDTGDMAQLTRIAPIIRGAMAGSSGNEDLPHAPVLLSCHADGGKGRADAIDLAALKPLDDAASLRDRLADAITRCAAPPASFVLPGVGTITVEAAASPSIDAAAMANRVALVTGAAGAIGYAVCRRLLESGCSVAVTDLPGERLDGLVAELATDAPGRVIGVGLDVTDRDSVTGALEAVAEVWGGVDIVVHNAGIALVSKLADLDLDAFRKLEKVNVEGTLLVLAATGDLLRRQGTGGDIVIMSTKNVPSPSAGFGAYSATKAACHQLGRIASLEMAADDIRVNMVAPDAVFSEGDYKSGLWEEVGADRMKARGLDEEGLHAYYRSRNLLKARVTGRHVANAVLFFVSRQTPTTGATIPVDGGLPDATPR